MTVLTYEYDATYPGPALPVVEIGIRRVGGEDEVFVPRAIIDSGADATLIPLKALQQVKARRVDQRRLRSLHGPSHVVDIFEVTLRIGIYTIPKVYVVANQHDRETIVGRDVLNQLIVTLHGPAGATEISQS